jgi:SAM-dependent methyltransferase
MNKLSKIIQRFQNSIWSLRGERVKLSYRYLRGKGIEIGALHNPLKTSCMAKASYVDRFQVSELRNQYPELAKKKLVNVDIIDNGELLASFPDESRDFIIANHFLEHTQNPLLALRTFFRVLNCGGILYAAVPDMRFTFDKNRTETTLDHIIRDFSNGPEKTRQEHYREWVTLVQGISEPDSIRKNMEKLMRQEYSIHFHTWTINGMMEMFEYARKQLNLPFIYETVLANDNEVIIIIRKKRINTSRPT